MDLLQQPLYGSFTVLHAAVAFVGVVVAAWLARKLFAPAERAQAHLREGRCASCGWSGQVSTHHRKCPACNGDIMVRGG